MPAILAQLLRWYALNKAANVAVSSVDKIADAIRTTPKENLNAKERRAVELAEKELAAQAKKLRDKGEGKVSLSWQLVSALNGIAAAADGVSGDELAGMSFDLIKLKGDFAQVVGQIEPNAAILLSGKKGCGKSTWALELVEELSHIPVRPDEKALVVSMEEGAGAMMQDRAKRLNLNDSNFTYTDESVFSKPKPKKGDPLKFRGIYDVVLIDSINYITGIDKHRIKATKQKYTKTRFVYISQVNKKGQAYGKEEIPHACDVVLVAYKNKDGVCKILCDKSRGGGSGEVPVHFERSKKKVTAKVALGNPGDDLMDILQDWGKETGHVVRELSPGLGKIQDTGKVRGASRVDRHWYKNPPMALFLNTPDIRQSYTVPVAFTQSLRNPDQTPQFLIDRYGLSGVKFGNWTTEQDRINYMYGTAFGLYDLQQITGFPNAAMGFYGRLGVCYGSRGVAGASGHFEPFNFLINLSRYNRGRGFNRIEDEDARRKAYLESILSRGCQAFVHEWFHALDYSFDANGMSSGGNRRRLANTLADALGEVDANSLQWKVVKLLYDACYTAEGEKTPFLKRLRRTGPQYGYYARCVEIWARMGEKYVAMKMKDKGHFNAFFGKFKHGSKVKRRDGLKDPVYLTDNEMRALMPQMEAIMNAYRIGLAGKKSVASKPKPKAETPAPKPSAPKPQPGEKPTGKQAPAGNGKQTYTGVIMVPIKAIYTDTNRFQNRDAEFSEASVQRIVDNFDENKMDAVTLWTDPKSGKIYMLSGHSRLEAHKRLKRTEILAKYFKGSEAEAIRFARVDANRSATAETVSEDVKAFKYERDTQKDTPETLKKRWKERYAKLEAWSHLEKGGMFLDALDKQEGFPYIQNKAMMVGQLRKHYPQLTNMHEREMFNFIYQNATGAKMDKDAFTARVSQIASRLDFDPSKKLHLEKSGPTGTEARADTAESQRRLYEVEAELQKLAERQRAAFTQSEKDSIKAERSRLMLEKERLERDIKKILHSQTALFGLVRKNKRRYTLIGQGANIVKRNATRAWIMANYDKHDGTILNEMGHDVTNRFFRGVRDKAKKPEKLVEFKRGGKSIYLTPQEINKLSAR